MNINRILNIINTDSRTSLLFKNVLFSFVLKGWSSVVVLIMVPLTLSCLGAYKNGVWLTISSLLVWIDQMDMGLGNGLRNALAVNMARQDYDNARKVVSSTFAILLIIVAPVALILVLLVHYIDVFSFLNVSYESIPELRTALIASIVLVCMTFVIKIIGNVYMGMQLPAVSNLILSLGQTTALLLTWGLYHTGHHSFTNIVIANTSAPLIVYILAYPYTFFYKFRYLLPSWKCVDLHIALQLGNLGLKFFWLQIAALIQFFTANILISRFFTPEMVTPYQITYRYMSIMLVVFTVVCMPFWNATTDAFEKKDLDWIRKASNKMNMFTVLIFLVMTVMVLLSPWVYQVWLRGMYEVSFSLTCMMALYIFLMIVSMRYSYFLNGIGVLRMQMYMTISAIVFIPLAWIVCSTTHNMIGFMTVMCVCNIPGIVVNIIQFHKIINGSATGIWKK